MPGAVLSLSATAGIGTEMAVLLVFQPPSALCLGKVRKREPGRSLILPGRAATPLSPCVPLVFADALAPSLRGWFSGLEVPSILLNAG